MKKAAKSRSAPHKIIEGLKEAIAQAAAPQSSYERIADRVLAAVTEMNASLQEAHECAEMRVFLAMSPIKEGNALKFVPQIYKLTHAHALFQVRVGTQDQKAQWQQVKDPTFQHVAGEGFAAFERKKASGRP